MLVRTARRDPTHPRRGHGPRPGEAEPDPEFDRYFMVTEVYLNHRRDVFGVSEHDGIYRSPTLFPTKQPVSAEEFHAATHGAHIVSSPRTRARVERLLEARGSHDLSGPGQP